MQTQKYLGTKSALVLCVDTTENCNIQGRMYDLYDKEPVRIYGFNDFLLKGEKLLGRLGTPKVSQSDRDFDNRVVPETPAKEVTMVHSDNEILDEHGDLGTYIVRIQHRQHSSWQGRVTWVEQDKTVYFRSELELTKLIEGSLDGAPFGEASGDKDDDNRETGAQNR